MIRKNLLLIGLLGICLGVRAQNVADSVAMDLETALKVALDKSPSVMIADREIAKKEYYKKEQSASLLPSLGVGATYNRAIQKQVMVMDFNGAPMKIEVGTDNTWGAGLNLALPLVAPALWKSVQLSELDIQQAVEGARSSKIALIAAVKGAYYSVLMAQDSYAVLDSAYRNAEFNAQIAANKYAQGTVSEFDKIRSEVRVRNQKPLVIAAANAVRLASMRLKAVMGVDVDEPIRFTGRLENFETQMTADFATLLGDSSLVDNSALRQMDIQALQLEKATSLIRSSYLPNLSLSGNYQWSSLNNDFQIGHYRWNPYATVGLALNIPIYAGSSKHYQVRQNELALNQLKLQREDVVRQLEVSLRNSINNIERSLEEVGSNRESVTLASRALSISRKRYEVGSGNLLELDDAQVALTNARLAFNQSIYNYLSARAEMEQTIGAAVEANPMPLAKSKK